LVVDSYPSMSEALGSIPSAIVRCRGGQNKKLILQLWRKTSLTHMKIRAV
jgi:hypothetical protein